jgi:NAD(P)-dependent dehydrogenase (short-subunit alcohol dehydrogenase family)
MDRSELGGKVALVTGGGSGIGAAVCRELARLGAEVVVADVADDAARAVADEVGGVAVHCDVREPGDNEAAVAAAVERFGGLDIAHLNAGVSTGTGVGDDFDLVAYRRAMAINLDGVVFGVQAALPALRARGGGDIVATSSMAGIVPVPQEPLYSANKHAVVGLARSLGALLGPEGIRVNALCPSFARTPLIEGSIHILEELKFPVLEVGDVVETFLAILESDRSGRCWFVVPGRESQPFEFRGAPGPRV